MFLVVPALTKKLNLYNILIMPAKRFSFLLWLAKFYRIPGYAGFPQALESRGKSWNLKVSRKVLGFVNFFEKSWKNSGILHNICSMNFLFQVVYNGFLRNCY